MKVTLIGPILWGHSDFLCHALSLLLLCGYRCAGGVRQWRRTTVAGPGEWQYKIRTGGVRRLAVANGPNIFQMLLVNVSILLLNIKSIRQHTHDILMCTCFVLWVVTLYYTSQYPVARSPGCS